jgi:hypothetical protein
LGQGSTATKEDENYLLVPQSPQSIVDFLFQSCLSGRSSLCALHVVFETLLSWSVPGDTNESARLQASCCRAFL